MSKHRCVKGLAPVLPSSMYRLGSSNSKLLETTAQVLERGGIVALPTDTVYGLVTVHRFCQKLFDVKRRDFSKPVGLFVKNVEQLKEVAEVTVNDELLDQLLPGPVTLLLKKLPCVELVSCNQLIGVRIPAHDFLQDLCRRVGEPLAQTSANLSGQRSTVDPLEFKELWENLDMVIADEEAPAVEHTRSGSTIIDLSTEGFYRIHRAGCARNECERILKQHGLKEIT